MLLTEEVEVALTSNIKWYENKGYTIPRHKNKRGRLAVKEGAIIKVKVQDLPKGSIKEVKIKCDEENCSNPIIKSIRWCDYLKYVHITDGKYYCQKCASKLFGAKKSKRTKLLKSESFAYWVIKNLSLQEAVKIIARWDYDKNGCDIRDVGFSSMGFKNKGYWFKCMKHPEHKSELKNISNLTNGAIKKIDCKVCNSFAQWGIDNLGEDFLEKYWDYDKNDKLGINPWKISYGKKTKVWIKCQEKDCYDSYYMCPNSFTNQNERCPSCARKRNESYLQEKIRLYLESLNNGKYTILHEYDCTIIPINPKTNHKMPFDNEIKELKLICEVNGEQHYEITNFHKLTAKHDNTTPEYELHYQQVKDRYKKFIAYKRGYNYMAIPYWTDDKKEIWKQLIDDKIKEILDKQDNINNKNIKLKDETTINNN